MKKLWLIPACLLLMALSPVYNEHDTQDKVDTDFRELFNNAQPLQFRVFTTTPNLSDLQNGEIVIFSSGAVKFMFRASEDIWTVQVSCITVGR